MRFRMNPKTIYSLVFTAIHFNSPLQSPGSATPQLILPFTQPPIPLNCSPLLLLSSLLSPLCLPQHHSLSLFHILLHHSSFIFLFISSLSPAEAPGQDFVTLDYRLRYYPSITYAVIGSAVIFVLVVALLALVLHHQRKRSVLLPRGVRGGSHHHHHHHQPLLLSRLVILDRGHVHPGGPGLSPGSPTAAGQYSSTTQALQLLSGTLYPSGLSMDSPPSYSQAVLDVR